MRRLALGLAAVLLLRADMYPDASNAKLPAAQANLGGTAVNVRAFGAADDARRIQCAVTATAASSAVTLAPGNALCAFAAADVGKRIVIYKAGSTATAPLATTIAAVTDATHLTLEAPAGQSLAAASTWVSWGTDNGPAIQAAYNQAAKRTDAAGQQGYVYFPPSDAHGNAAGELHGGYGTANAIDIAPNSYPAKTAGAGRFSSILLALAPMASLVGKDAGYVNGVTVSDMTFDGNQLATNVGNMACLPEGHLRNVSFANPAAGGIGYLHGQPGSGSCPDAKGYDVIVNAVSELYTNAAQYPAKLMSVNSTDTLFSGLSLVGQANTSSLTVEATASNTKLLSPHPWGNTAAPDQIRVLAAKTTIYDLQGDIGSATNVARISAAQTSIFGGAVVGPGASTVGVKIDANTPVPYVSGFNCYEFGGGVPANCIVQDYPAAGSVIVGNPGSQIKPANASVANQTKTGTTTTAAPGVFLGLGLTFTPKASGVVQLAFRGSAYNSVLGNGGSATLKLGTGTTPANAQACSTGGGTTVITGGTPVGMYAFAANQPHAISDVAVIGNTTSPLTLGTQYWADVCIQAVTGGTFSVINADLRAKETQVEQ